MFGYVKEINFCKLKIGNEFEVVMEEKMTRDDMLFFGAYILYLIVATIKNTQLWSIIPMASAFELLRIGSVVMVCFKIVLDKEYTRRQVTAICCIIAIIFLSCIYSRDFDLLYFICFAFGIKGIAYFKVLRVTFSIHIIVICIIIISVSTGIISNEMMGSIVWSETMISDEFTQRYTLGFGHPNTASSIVLFVTMIYMCMRNKCSFLEFVIGFGINFMVYQKTGSRTCFIIAIIFLPLMYWFANKKKFQGYWQVLLTIAPIIIILTATLMQVFYNPNNELFVEIDTLLSSRLRLGHQGFLDYGITLFGQNIFWVGMYNIDNEYGFSYNYVDSAYMRILLDHGIIVYIFFCIAAMITMYYLVKIKNGKLCIAFLALLVHSIVEISIYNISVSPFCLLMGQMAVLDYDKK